MADIIEFAYDVFISYSHANKAWVRGELLQRLEVASLRVCIDYRDFRPGAPSVKEMERAVLTSRKTLLILTPDYVNSSWADFEALIAATLDPANQNLRLIPLRKAKCELPLRIKYLTYVDFAEPDDPDWAWTQLLTALGAPPALKPTETPRRDAWNLKHPYPMPPNFTGRVAEREMLTQWLTKDNTHPLMVLRALGGFGKSALCWHWLLNDVAPAQFPRVVWWSFYEGDANFDSFLRETLEYMRVDPRQLGPRQQADALLHLLHQPGTLLVLDGFERALRAYSSMNAAYQGDAVGAPSPSQGEGWGGGQSDCVSPIAEHFLRSLCTLPGIRGKALMTTRLRPRALESHGELLQGCREQELTQMQPADAVAFFRAQGIRGGRAEIEAACAPYGYHPLSLRLLAGLIVRDFLQPGDISAAKRLDVTGDLVARQHHVLEQAYNSLTPERQKLLSRIACFRSPVSYEALCIVAKTSQVSETCEVSCDDELRDLLARGLLHHDAPTNRYDLHPIVRRYAYDRLTGAERAAAHAHLRDYFAAVPQPDKVRSLDDLMPVIELYHHTVRAGQFDEARALWRNRLSPNPLYFQFGAYQLIIELVGALFPEGEDHPPRLKEESGQAWTLNELANSYSKSGQPRRAVPLYEGYIAISEKRGDKTNTAIGLGNLATAAQLHIGALQAVEVNLRRCVALCREIKDEFWEAVGHQESGRLLAYQGVWAESEEELASSTAYWKQTNDVQGLCIDHAYRALRALLLGRAQALISPSKIGRGKVRTAEEEARAALSAARRALELADEWQRQVGRLNARDYVRAHWLLGAAHRAGGEMDQADRHLSEALTRCRGINLVEMEADILLNLARLRAAQGHGEEALGLAQEALIITERSEYVLQGADVHLFLAQMVLDAGDKRAASGHAREARRLATCDGPPDYTYKVAYDEAGALLNQLGVEASAGKSA